LRHWFGGKTKTISSEEAVKMGLKNKTYVVINSVWNQSPAQKAGLRKNDILISIDNQEIFNLTSLEYYIIVTEDLPTIPLTISREGKEIMINFPIEYPEEIPLRNSTLIKGSNPLNGVVLENISPVLMQELNLDIIKGVVIAEINPNSYAKRANLKKGDILLTINEEVIISVNQAKEILKNNSSQNWEIEISRNNKIYLLKVSL
jgi:serine protease Do